MDESFANLQPHENSFEELVKLNAKSRAHNAYFQVGTVNQIKY